MTLRRVLLIAGSALLLTLCIAIASVWLFPRTPTSPALFLPKENTGAVLWMESPAFLLEAGTALLQEEQRQAWSTFAQTWSRNALGPNVSLRYDILPVLSRTLLWWEDTTDTWTVRTIVRGDARTFLDTLHASYRSTFPAIRHTNQLLDDRFPLDMLALDTTTPIDTEIKVEEWTLRTTTPTNGSGSLISAQRGHEIVLGNSMVAVRARLKENMPSPSLWSTFGAFGSLHRTLVASDLAPILLPASFQKQAAQRTETTILWSLAKSKNVLTWTIHD